MDTYPRDPEALKRRGIIQRVLGGMNLRFPGLFALLAVVTVLDFLIPDPIPFIDEIVLALLTMLFALWKDRRLATVDVTKATAGPPLPPSRPPLPPIPPEAR